MTGGAYPPTVAIVTPESDACTAAAQAELERCLAAGMRLREARIEAAKAAASERRVQLGLPAVDPGDLEWERRQAERKRLKGKR